MTHASVEMMLAALCCIGCNPSSERKSQSSLFLSTSQIVVCIFASAQKDE